ncbi:hypothetical protein F7R91_22730 [Streptomyces luteolifulvus]|jgi:hypothetical protein|uniref:Lipoprotein n=1 Tax=Streptomyces luteolifulvus TaxID=2615112 RepID=A0A6H9UWL7_9ACTN|nr:hypothetical protein [Streptomyces luteolifulvus]KAB1144176.1 hypothetical protein F7R91_22730 [Streptomyces luteolifulvus]
MKRAALCATAVSLSLAALTACSGGDADAKPEHSPGSSPARAKQVGPAERLAKIMVTQKDVSGRTVKEMSDDFLFAKSPDEVTVDKAACAPLVHAMNQLPLGEPQADLTRVVSTEKYGDEDVYITLTAYAAGKAEPTMAALSKGVESCGPGFTAKANGNTSTYDSIAAEDPAAAAGDETVAFKSTMTFRGVTHTLHTEAVRRDDVIAVCFSVNGLAIVKSTPSDAKLPTAVVKAQNAKLG